MFFKQLLSGGGKNFCYIVADERTKECAFIDPSPDPTSAINEAKKNSFKIVYVINTHSHYDHTGGNARVSQISDAKIVAYSSSPGGDIKVNDGDVIPLGDIGIKIIHTPGHTDDSMCVLAEDHLIAGDTLFVGRIGGTYTDSDALTEFESLKRLMKLDDHISVWPGHNYGLKESSTIKEERETNPFCTRLNDFKKFCDLKENWLEYKRKHGLT
ncbi:MAG: hydroxyacylglutathione hydrolase family protein [Candidatus Anammoxibacter sp.]